MRQLVVRVPSGEGKSVLATAKKHGGVNLLLFEATSNYHSERVSSTSEENYELVDVAIVHLDNVRVENFLGELESIPDLSDRGV